MQRAEILMISKPIAPPWSDSTKNLVLDLVSNTTKYNYRILTTPEYKHPSPFVLSDPIYKTTGHYTPSLWQNLRVLKKLLQERSSSLYHFFFAPNPRTSLAAKIIKQIKKKPTVQTICSIPKSFENISRYCFGDIIIALSDYTLDMLIKAGIPKSKTYKISPGISIPNLKKMKDIHILKQKFKFYKPTILFPGDLEFSSAGEIIVQALKEVLPKQEALFVFACRIKGPQSIQKELKIKKEVHKAGFEKNVLFFNEVSNMKELIYASDIVIFPQEKMYAKMDIPLVLIEALSLKKPIIIADISPLREILNKNGPGVLVPPLDPLALCKAILQLLKDKKRRETIGEKGPKLVEQKYDIKKMAKEYEDIYQRLLS